MGQGWKEVARVGGAGLRYPHILVDSHGWCLRLGSKPRTDEKTYSSLPLLLHGLLEHFIRRRLMGVEPLQELRGLIREVKDALHSALGLCREALEKGGLEEHIRRLEAPRATPSAEGSPPPLPNAPGGAQAVWDPETRRQAV